MEAIMSSGKSLYRIYTENEVEVFGIYIARDKKKFQMANRILELIKGKECECYAMDYHQYLRIVEKKKTFNEWEKNNSFYYKTYFFTKLGVLKLDTGYPDVMSKKEALGEIRHNHCIKKSLDDIIMNYSMHKLYSNRKLERLLLCHYLQVDSKVSEQDIWV